LEEQSLYRAILAAPHDDTLRLVYADWLDENADRFADPLARLEHGRAEFIRVQCALARLGPGGWGTPLPTDPVLARRQKRLFLQYGAKWRRWFPRVIASSPFERGFLRPMRAMRPQEFLEQQHGPDLPIRAPMPPLPPDSPAIRYVPEADSLFPACPLWDIHLYATPFIWDQLADHGQYEELLEEVGRSPSLERVGWLKVSFFHTPVVDFLRTGNFVNVETLVLNSGPIPDVLEAITENESFHSLRYLQFGDDREAWIPDYPTALRFNAFHGQLRAANERHLPYGEMRTVLRQILRDTPVVPAQIAPPPPAVIRSTPVPLSSLSLRSPGTTLREHLAAIGWGALAFCLIFGLISVLANTRHESPPTSPKITFDFDPDKYKLPDLKAYQKALKTLEEGLKELKGELPVAPPPRLVDPARSPDELPVAPPPRPVEKQD